MIEDETTPEPEQAEPEAPEAEEAPEPEEAAPEAPAYPQPEQTPLGSEGEIDIDDILDPEAEPKVHHDWSSRGDIPDMLEPTKANREQIERARARFRGHQPDAIIPKRGYSGTRKAADRREQAKAALEATMQPPEVLRERELREAMRNMDSMNVAEIFQYLPGLAEHQRQVHLIAEKLTQDRKAIAERWSIDPVLSERYESLWAQTHN